MKPPLGILLISATYIQEYKFVFKFSNDVESIVDFKPIISFGESLLDYLDVSKFKEINFDKERGDIWWGENYDLCFHIASYYGEVEFTPIIK